MADLEKRVADLEALGKVMQGYDEVALKLMELMSSDIKGLERRVKQLEDDARA